MVIASIFQTGVKLARRLLYEMRRGIYLRALYTSRIYIYNNIYKGPEAFVLYTHNVYIGTA